LQDIDGVFLDNEDLDDDQGGHAICNGALSFSNAALVGTVASIRAAQETDATWDATFVANGPEIELRVTGASSKTIEWECDVDGVELMPDPWKPLPLDKGLFANLEEDAIQAGQTAIENGFVNEQGGNTRFPGPHRARRPWRPGSRLCERAERRHDRRDEQGQGLPDQPALSGRRRDRRSGVRRPARDLRNDRPRRAADGRRRADHPAARQEDRAAQPLAPLATHVQWIDGYTIATETNSGRFRNSAPGEPDQWDPLDSFAADGNPDNINSMIVTPYRELMLGGANSIEQFERLRPATRRSSGAGRSATA
jgi:hypothetical protein